MEATGPPPDGDVNRGPLIIAVSFVEFAFALLLVVLRFYTRIKLVRKIGLDDWLVLAALVRNFVDVGISLQDTKLLIRFWL